MLKLTATIGSSTFTLEGPITTDLLTAWLTFWADWVRTGSDTTTAARVANDATRIESSAAAIGNAAARIDTLAPNPITDVVQP